MAAPKPTPVEIYHFPHRRKSGRARTLTQTLPDVKAYEPPTVSEVSVAMLLDGGDPIRRPARPDEKPPAKLPDVKSPPSDGQKDMSDLGHELLTLGKFNEAKVVFEGLLLANPADSFALTMLGTVHLAQHELEKALEAFNRALTLDPQDVAALVYRGEIRLKRKKFKVATEDLSRAVKLAAATDPFADRANRLLKLAKQRKP